MQFFASIKYTIGKLVVLKIFFTPNRGVIYHNCLPHIGAYYYLLLQHFQQKQLIHFILVLTDSKAIRASTICLVHVKLKKSPQQ